MTSAHLLYIEVRVEQRHEHYVVWYLPVTCISHFRCHSDIGSSFKGPSSLNCRSVINVNMFFFLFTRPDLLCLFLTAVFVKYTSHCLQHERLVNHACLYVHTSSYTRHSVNQMLKLSPTVPFVSYIVILFLMLQKLPMHSSFLF
uniref:Uncharacterized protein n=1 Tax=Rhipicephalus microplus TaxID=6941 RepID=A0A6G5AGK1_RHIMP